MRSHMYADAGAGDTTALKNLQERAYPHRCESIQRSPVCRAFFGFEPLPTEIAKVADSCLDTRQVRPPRGLRRGVCAPGPKVLLPTRHRNSLPRCC